MEREGKEEKEKRKREAREGRVSNTMGLAMKMGSMEQTHPDETRLEREYSGRDRGGKGKEGKREKREGREKKKYRWVGNTVMGLEHGYETRVEKGGRSTKGTEVGRKGKWREESAKRKKNSDRDININPE